MEERAGRTANRLVAGVPAAARLAQGFAAVRPGKPLVIWIADGKALTPHTEAEIARLAPGVAVQIANAAPAEAILAEALTDPAAMAAFLEGKVHPAPIASDAALAQAARAIIRATAKPTDGMIARRINRPLSQAMSAQLLRSRRVRPGYATALTAVAALAMLACLVVFPSPAGLAAGAVLFQLASIIDGVDGEIARATRRSSKAGASLDSLIDAFTNCAFLAGAGACFALQGDNGTALVCAAATGVQIVGLTLLGRNAWVRKGVVHFDSAKAAVAPIGAGRGRMLKDLTSRDFYCFAFMLASFAGLLGPAIAVFLAGSLVWLIFVIRTAVRGR
jgi:CDP-L-myo-inositol myo-inositolphosphotransferase